MRIVIVDYQMGNLRSVQKAFEHVGYRATITNDPHVVSASDKVVLPGVGAFGDAMRELGARDLIEPLRDFIRAGRPFLGICLGLQLLFDVSHEGGRQPGLGVLRGEVVRFADLPPRFKIPHMGWNQATIRQPCPVLEGIDDDAHFYFVHSYYAVPADPAVVAMTADYERPFCAMVCRENLFATQFHPEKSQRNGLCLLRNFAALPVD